MPSFRRLPVNKVIQYYIVDGGQYLTDKEYIDLGVKEGWLELFRIVTVKNGESIHKYKYPDNYKCE